MLQLTLCDQKMTPRSVSTMTANTAHNQSPTPFVRWIEDADGLVCVNEAGKEGIVVMLSCEDVDAKARGCCRTLGIS
jgi:hypothetical protein